MDESLSWLLTNAQEISVTALLAFALLALHREWIVLGKTHRDCIKRRDEHELTLKQHAVEQAAANAELRHEFALLQQSHARRRSA